MRISEDRGKLSSKDDFELVLFRWKYLNKTKNPDKETMKKYETPARDVSRKMFAKFAPVFKSMGFELEDLHSIAMVHTVSFIGLFSLGSNPEKMESFVVKFTENNGFPPSQEDIEAKDMKDCYSFLTQRLKENALHTKRKLQMINGHRSFFRAFICDHDPGTVSQKRKILKSNTDGFKEIDMVTAESLAGTKKLTSMTKSLPDGKILWITKHRSPQKVSVISDIYFDPTRFLSSSPEEIMIDMENDLLDMKNKDRFDKMTIKNKRSALKRFLKNNSASDTKQERALAREMLKNLKTE